MIGKTLLIFEMWSLFHILFLLAPVVLTIILYFSLRNKSPKTQRIVGIILSVVAVIDLGLRNVEIFIQGANQLQPDIIPLQICHLAAFIMLFAFLLRSRVMFAIAFCFNLPFAAMSIIFADGLAHMATVISFRGLAYLLGHTLIVGTTVWALLSKQFVINKKAHHLSMIIILVYYFATIPINNLFTRLMPDFISNYAYSMRPEIGTPMEMFYGWGEPVVFLGMEINFVYLSLMFVLGVVAYFLFYGIYKWFEYRQAASKKGLE